MSLKENLLVKFADSQPIDMTPVQQRQKGRYACLPIRCNTRVLSPL